MARDTLHTIGCVEVQHDHMTINTGERAKVLEIRIYQSEDTVENEWNEDRGENDIKSWIVLSVDKVDELITVLEYWKETNAGA